VPALTDEWISRAIEAASEMYVAGRDGVCPNLRFNMGALIDMLTSDGLQVQDIEAGAAASSVMRMVMAAKALRQESVNVLRHPGCGLRDGFDRNPA
jgi:hypothetical protein